MRAIAWFVVLLPSICLAEEKPIVTDDDSATKLVESLRNAETEEEQIKAARRIKKAAKQLAEQEPRPDRLIWIVRSDTARAIGYPLNRRDGGRRETGIEWRSEADVTACEAIAILGDNESFPLISQLVMHEEFAVRREAYKALGRANHPKADKFFRFHFRVAKAPRAELTAQLAGYEESELADPDFLYSLAKDDRLENKDGRKVALLFIELAERLDERSAAKETEGSEESE